MLRTNKLSNITMLVVLLTSLNGCTLLENKSSRKLNYKLRIHTLAQKHQWEISGRVGVIGEQQSGSASLFWKQDNDEYNIQVIAPLGTKKVIIVGTQSFIDIKNSNGQHIESDNPSNALSQELGWTFPLQYLKYWIKGIPSPTEKYTWLPSINGKYSFTQEHWKTSFSLNDTDNDSSLPKLVVIENDNAKIKISISSWS
ncbi:MAG: outer membrane lipoprotein LolB [Francisellaceae bacterium]|nr:outer membrane lipoprotein LolB [Francisellaceae bacterium]MBT6537936.1 outer membrane lipoprotein LolB [Francisellaceae bacterium]